MSDLTEHPQVREALIYLSGSFGRTRANPHPQVVEAEDRLISAIVSAYRSALAGETPESLVEAAAKAMAPILSPAYRGHAMKDIRVGSGCGWCDRLIETVGAALAPLLVQLQDKNERIKALEAALEAHAGCLATDRCPACSAIPEAR